MIFENLFTKNKRSVCTCYILFILTLSVSAQSSDYSRDVIPPHPVTANLGNYGSIPVGLCSGTANIDLNIYTLSEGGISIPITAGYSSNGVQIDALAKQLGLEWNLNVGGVISRQIVGADDLTFDFYSNNNPEDLCTIPNSDVLGLPNINTQKDIFSYNAMGNSGKFIIDGNSLQQIEVSKNKIERNATDNGVNYPFKITDVLGNEYFFGGLNAQETTNVLVNCGSGHQVSGLKTTGWYLSRIKTSTGSIATFLYERDNYTTISYQQEAKISTRNDILTSQEALINQPCNSTDHHTTPILKEIVVNDKKISFSYQNIIPGTSESVQLVNLKVYSNSSTVYKTIEFTYFPVTSNKRIFLKEIIEKSSDNLSSVVKYSFEYYNHESLPAKNSYAKDIYGYYNARSNTNLVYNNLNSTDGILYDLFGNVNANREPNTLVMHYGLLKSITYPTKGKTEFEYEPNSINKNKVIYPPKAGIIAAAEFADTTTEVESANFTIPFPQQITLKGGHELVLTTYPDEEAPSCTINNYPTHWTPFSLVYLINVATNQTVGYLNTQYNSFASITVPQGVYKLRVKNMRRCVATRGEISYVNQLPYTVNINETVGGSRIVRTKDYDNNGNVQIKRYHYADLNNLNVSSGAFISADPKLTPNVELTIKVSEGYATHTYRMSSDTMDPIHSFFGSVIQYSKVVESFGENFENGGIVHHFSLFKEIAPERICQGRVRGRPNTNTFRGGEEIKTEVFTKVGSIFKILSSTEYTYAPDLRFNFSVNNLAKSSFINFPWDGSVQVSETSFNVEEYEIRSYRRYLSSKIESQFFGNKQIVTTTTYNYDNPAHLQLTSKISNSSTGANLESKYFYPQDLSTEPNTTTMTNRNMIGIPLKEQNFSENILLSEQLTKYGVFPSNDPAKPNFLPEFIYAKKESLPMEKNVTYKYNAFGKMTQYTQENGTPVSIIWGVNNTLPIAKIENATYVQVLAALGTNESAIGLLTVAPANIRTVLANARVTTYTYIPLVGVSSITDPKGDVLTYEYDGFGRLKFVKDRDNNILSESQYHYKN